MRHFPFILALAVCATAPAMADDWSCRNESAEITCDAEKCTIAPPGEFTPAELTVGHQGALSYCAYSGCWSGSAASTLRSGRFLTVTGFQLEWSGTSGSPVDLAATIDTKLGRASVLTGDYAQPMTCSYR